MDSDEYITQLAIEEFPNANPYRKVDKMNETPIVKKSCGCLILVIAKKGGRGKTNLSGFRIEHCPLHKSAPDLLEACKEGKIRLAFLQRKIVEAKLVIVDGIEIRRTAACIKFMEQAITKTKKS